MSHAKELLRELYTQVIPAAVGKKGTAQNADALVGVQRAATLNGVPAMERPVRGMYFEDFQVGMELTTPARTVTATDIVNFCCLTGDFNEVHANVEYARTTPFGEPIAHGPLIYGMSEGLQYASGINDGTLLALLGIDRWRIHLPTKPGDTIHLVQTVTATRPTSKGDRGVVTLQRTVRNQRGEAVMEMEATLLYKCRPA